MLFNYFRDWSSHSNIEVLEGYVRGVELDIARSIDAFRGAELETEVIHLDDERSPQVIEFYQGMDSATWDLEELFCTHYPSMQRTAALLAVYSSIEDELNNLCQLVQQHHEHRLNVYDIHGLGLPRATMYLEKVVGLDRTREHDAWRELMAIGKVRNKFAHAAGHLRDGDELVAYVDKRPDLSLEGAGRSAQQRRIILQEGYLSYAVDSAGRYYRHLSELINDSDLVQKIRRDEQKPQ